MKAFITGSRVYGTPLGHSDLDLVVFVDPADLARLEDFGLQHNAGSGSGSDHNMSFRFGGLNLIALSDPDDYALWRDGTLDLRARRGAVTRDFAVRHFESMRAFRDAENRRFRETPVGVQTSLYQMVRIPNTRPLWPADFEGKIALLEGTPNDKSRWGVIADWLDENDEPELAGAFRWVFNRRDANVGRVRDKPGYANHFRRDWWEFYSLPPALLGYWATDKHDLTTLPGLAACLASALVKAKEDLA